MTLPMAHSTENTDTRKQP